MAAAAFAASLNVCALRDQSEFLATASAFMWICSGLVRKAPGGRLPFSKTRDFHRGSKWKHRDSGQTNGAAQRPSFPSGKNKTRAESERVLERTAREGEASSNFLQEASEDAGDAEGGGNGASCSPNWAQPRALHQDYRLSAHVCEAAPPLCLHQAASHSSRLPKGSAANFLSHYRTRALNFKLQREKKKKKIKNHAHA